MCLTDTQRRLPRKTAPLIVNLTPKVPYNLAIISCRLQYLELGGPAVVQVALLPPSAPFLPAVSI